MKQATLAGFEKYGKTTRRAQFLADMDKIIPWTELSAAVQAAYPSGRPVRRQPPLCRSLPLLKKRQEMPVPLASYMGSRAAKPRNSRTRRPHD
jgi:hypothetical protein